MLSIPGDFERFKDMITSITSPFFTGLKWNLLLLGFTLYLILLKSWRPLVCKATQSFTATLVIKILKPFAISFFSFVKVKFILNELDLCLHTLLSGKHFFIAFQSPYGLTLFSCNSSLWYSAFFRLTLLSWHFLM